MFRLGLVDHGRLDCGGQRTLFPVDLLESSEGPEPVIESASQEALYITPTAKVGQ